MFIESVGMGNVCVNGGAKVTVAPYYSNSDEIYFSHLGLTVNDLEKFAKVFLDVEFYRIFVILGFIGV